MAACATQKRFEAEALCANAMVRRSSCGGLRSSATSAAMITWGASVLNASSGVRQRSSQPGRHCQAAAGAAGTAGRPAAPCRCRWLLPWGAALRAAACWRCAARLLRHQQAAAAAKKPAWSSHSSRAARCVASRYGRPAGPASSAATRPACLATKAHLWALPAPQG